MSEKSSQEYHKKTCIICGCHTNQTINIYEPRSGPNIVRLIQARFKFQPLNEDKYLCYSCNNWLINWHSLQALNSNDADNPSGTFRSSQINNMVSEKGAPSDKMTKCTKPIAQVRPQLRNQPEPIDDVQHMPKRNTPYSTNTKRNGSYFSKHTFLSCHRMKKIRRKSIYFCSVCGRSILRRISPAVARSKTTPVSVKCKTCREMSQWRDMYLKLQEEQQLSKTMSVRQPHVNLVNDNSMHTGLNSTVTQLPPRYQRPRIDGKVVSMLRRLGTTLSRDSTSISMGYQPPIMSPTKNTTQRWTRDIDEDEIVIDFNTAITEVLPIRRIRRKLAYHVSDATTSDAIQVDSSDDEEDGKENCEINLQHVYSLVPKGLTISLITDSKPIPVN